jgi:hypothetical protein
MGFKKLKKLEIYQIIILFNFRKVIIFKKLKVLIRVNSSLFQIYIFHILFTFQFQNFKISSLIIGFDLILFKEIKVFIYLFFTVFFSASIMMKLIPHIMIINTYSNETL